MARGNGRADVVALAVGLVVVPPALMLAVEALARLVRPALGQAAHLLFVGFLAAALVIQVLDAATGLPAGALVAVALLAGAGGAVAYARTTFVPTVLSVLTPAPAVFVVLFLFFSPVKGIVLPHGDAEALDVEIGSDAPVVMLVLDESSISRSTSAAISTRRYELARSPRSTGSNATRSRTHGARRRSHRLRPRRRAPTADPRQVSRARRHYELEHEDTTRSPRAGARTRRSVRRMESSSPTLRRAHGLRRYARIRGDRRRRLART